MGERSCLGIERPEDASFVREYVSVRIVERTGDATHSLFRFLFVFLLVGRFGRCRIVLLVKTEQRFNFVPEDGDAAHQRGLTAPDAGYSRYPDPCNDHWNTFYWSKG